MEHIKNQSILTPEEENIMLLSNRLAIVDGLRLIVLYTPLGEELDPKVKEALAIAQGWPIPNGKTLG